MKNIIWFSLHCVICFITLLCTNIKTKIILAQNIDNRSEIYTFQQTKEKEDIDCGIEMIKKRITYNYNGLIFQIEDNKKSHIEEIEKNISLLPDNVITTLVENKWQIVITKQDIAKEHYNGEYESVYGTTNYKEKKIYIENRDNAIDNALIHECAHVYDHENDYISDNIEFHNVLKIDYENFDKLNNNYEYWKQDDMESFAEAVHLCYKDQKTFQKQCPNMYAYIRGIIEN